SVLQPCRNGTSLSSLYECCILSLQRRLILTLGLSPDIYFPILTTVSGGRGCYRRVGRQTRRLPFPSLRSLGAISTLLWTNSVGSTPPFARVLRGRNRG